MPDRNAYTNHPCIQPITCLNEEHFSEWATPSWLSSKLFSLRSPRTSARAASCAASDFTQNEPKISSYITSYQSRVTTPPRDGVSSKTFSALRLHAFLRSKLQSRLSPNKQPRVTQSQSWIQKGQNSASQSKHIKSLSHGYIPWLLS